MDAKVHGPFCHFSFGSGLVLILCFCFILFFVCVGFVGFYTIKQAKDL